MLFMPLLFRRDQQGHQERLGHWGRWGWRWVWSHSLCKNSNWLLLTFTQHNTKGCDWFRQGPPGKAGDRGLPGEPGEKVKMIICCWHFHWLLIFISVLWMWDYIGPQTWESDGKSEQKVNKENRYISVYMCEYFNLSKQKCHNAPCTQGFSCMHTWSQTVLLKCNTIPAKKFRLAVLSPIQLL